METEPRATSTEEVMPEGWKNLPLSPNCIASSLPSKLQQPCHAGPGPLQRLPSSATPQGFVFESIILPRDHS